MLSSRLKQQNRGNTLVEYGVVLALVAVVCIGSVMALGLQVDDVVGMILGDAGKGDKPIGVVGTPAGRNTNVETGGAVSGSPTEGGSGGGKGLPKVFPLRPGQERVCFESGYCVNVPAVSGKSVDTSGTMGSDLTKQMSSVIEQVAVQLAANPNADPALVKLISDLANQGHKMGDIQGEMESICPPGNSCSYEPAEVEQKGNQLLNMMEQLTITEVDGFENKLETLQGFIRQNPGSLPPEVMSLIEMESKQILSITDGYAEDPSRQYVLDMQTNMVASPVNNAKLTHQSANSICAKGGSNCSREPGSNNSVAGSVTTGISENATSAILENPTAIDDSRTSNSGRGSRSSRTSNSGPG